MSETVRAWIIQFADGSMLDGAPFDTYEEAVQCSDHCTNYRLPGSHIVELVEVVRCRNCAKRPANGTDDVCDGGYRWGGADWFCADGQRKDEP